MADNGGNDGRRDPFTYWRDVCLFVVATALLVYEAVGRDGEPRWALLVVYAGILGVPLVLPRTLGGRERNGREGSNGETRSD